jgi:hypothetical protein
MSLTEEEDGLLDELFETETLAIVLALDVVLGHPAHHAVHRWVLTVQTKLLVLGFHEGWIKAVTLLSRRIIGKKLKKVISQLIHGHRVDFNS